MDNSNNNNQFRFITAAVLSMLVLLGWSYFYAPTPPAKNTNTADANTSQTAPAQPAPTQQAALPQPTTPVPAAAFDTVPNRSITIKSPLYETTLDSKGAVATSWILLRSRSTKNDYPIYADGSNANEKKPMQLISHRALEQSPRELPFRLLTGDDNLTTIANERNYQISSPEAVINLAADKSNELILC
jgi:YidC/Oxa1 family membrane protein insertase